MKKQFKMPAKEIKLMWKLVATYRKHMRHKRKYEIQSNKTR